jgi:hypothetical protein
MSRVARRQASSRSGSSLHLPHLYELTSILLPIPVRYSASSTYALRRFYRPRLRFTSRTCRNEVCGGLQYRHISIAACRAINCCANVHPLSLRCNQVVCNEQIRRSTALCSTRLQSATRLGTTVAGHCSVSTRHTISDRQRMFSRHASMRRLLDVQIGTFVPDRLHVLVRREGTSINLQPA